MSARERRFVTPEAALVAALFLLLAGGIVYPLWPVLSAALFTVSGPSLDPLVAFFARPPSLRALGNTMLSGVLVVLFGSIIGVGLALLTTRFSFRGRSLVTVVSVVPLVIPPFVGAVSFQQILGTSGPVNLLLLEWFGFSVPFMDGLTGVVLVQTLHYFPFIMLNTSAALSGLDKALEEAAQGLGASSSFLFRRVVLPLALPGYAAGALLTFILVIDDLGTPLMLNYTALLAPQAYLRIATGGIADVDGAVVCAVLLALSLAALGAVKVALSRGEGSALGRGIDAPAVALGPRGTALAWLIAVALLGPALLPQTGIALLSVSKVWSQSPLPTAYTPGHFEAILFGAPHFIWNTLGYSLLAAVADVLLGAVIAWLLLRGTVRGRGGLGALAAMPLAIPGVVIAVGYLGVFHGFRVPGLGEPLTATWLALVIVFAIRRLPYAVRGGAAAFRTLPATLEEAAQSLGANRARTFAKITLPLIARGLAAAGLFVFVVSAVDFSATLLLVPRLEQGPLSYGIYLSMQSAIGRGPGAALGVVAIVLVAAGTWAATRLASRSVSALFRA